MKIKKTVFLALTGLMLFAGHSGAVPETLRAVISNLSGTAEIKPSREKHWVEAKDSATLSEGDIVRTKKDSFLVLTVKNGGDFAVIELKENSQLMFLEFAADNKTKEINVMLDLAVGEATIKTKDVNEKKCKFEVKTPTSIVGVREGSASFNVKVEYES